MSADIQEEVFAPEFMVATSDVSEVYATPYDRSFVIRSKLFGEDFITKAYANDMNVNVASGKVDFKVNWRGGGCRNVMWPFHFYRDGILYALKNNKQRNVDAFCLNHELFALEWDACVILYSVDEQSCVFIASREEWQKDGKPVWHEELQVLLKVPNYRRLPLSFIPIEAGDWAKAALDRGEAS